MKEVLKSFLSLNRKSVIAVLLIGVVALGVIRFTELDDQFVVDLKQKSGFFTFFLQRLIHLYHGNFNDVSCRSLNGGNS